MKVSVITPTYQAVSYIAECIRSVAEQTFPVFEHIVIDGGSSDGTVELVRACRADNPRLNLVTERDEGIYDAMNKGLAKATGDYIFFLGADDVFWDHDTLRRVIEALAGRRPDVFYGNIQAVGTGLRGVPDGGIYGGKFDLQRLISQNICHQAIFYSRTLMLRAGGFNIRYRYLADWDYNLRCFALSRFEHIDVTIARFFTTGRSACSDDNAFHAAFFEEVGKYFGLSLFSRYYKSRAGYMGFSGKLRLREKKDARGLLYLAAASWHSPKYFVKQLGLGFGDLFRHFGFSPR